MLQWLTTVGLPIIQQNADIAMSVGEAEILKNHYETGFYSIAKVLQIFSILNSHFNTVYFDCVFSYIGKKRFIYSFICFVFYRKL